MNTNANTLTLLSLLILALAQTVALTASAAPAVRSHPVPVQFDGAFQPAQIYLRYTSERIDSAYAQWRDKANSPADRVFKQLVDGLRDNDLAAVRPLLDQQVLRGTPAQFMRRLRASFDNLAQIRVISRADLGERRIYYFRAVKPGHQGVFTAGFEVAPRAGGLRVQLVTGNLAIASLIAYALDGEARDAGLFAPVSTSKTGFAVPLDSASGVRLEFNLTPVALDPFAPPASLPSAPVEAWVRAVQQLREGNWPAFAAAHTAVSQAKIREISAGGDDAARTQSAAVLTSGLRLMAELPLGLAGSLLICSQGDSADRASHVLRYVWVARTPEGLRLTNFFKRYALGALFQRAEGWPKQAGQLELVIRRDQKGGR